MGGAIVSAFALLGEMCKPKTFAGIFGAAPSVALATLGLALLNQGSSFAALEGRSMVLGAVAFVAYSAAERGVCDRSDVRPCETTHVFTVSLQNPTSLRTRENDGRCLHYAVQEKLLGDSPRVW